MTLIHSTKDKEHDGSLVWGHLHFISERTRERGGGEDTVFLGNLTPWDLLSRARCLTARAAATSYNSEANLYFLICEHPRCSLRQLAGSSSFPAGLHSQHLCISPQIPSRALCMRAISQLHGLDGKSSRLGTGAGRMEGGRVWREPGCSPSGEGWVLRIYAAVHKK